MKRVISRLNLIQLKLKKKVVIVFFLMIMILKINSQEIKECTIKDYDISVGKNLTSIMKIKYDQKGRVIEERYYQGFLFGVSLHSVTFYEYPDEFTEIVYNNSKYTYGTKTIVKYDKARNIIKMTSNRIKVDVNFTKWIKTYNQYEYIQIIEHEFEYNEHNDLVLAKSIQGKFVDMPGPLENLPNDGLNGKVEEFKYEYNDKGQKIKVFGKNNKKNEYTREWRYFYDDEGNMIKVEKYILGDLSNYTEYKYINKKIIAEFYWSGDYKDGKRLGYEIAGYTSYEYYDNGRLKRVNHHDTEFKKIEDMKIWSYEEYEYK